MGAIKAASLRIDLSVGKFDSGFTYLMQPNTNGSQSTSIFDFTQIDTLADGLKAQKVCPTSTFVSPHSSERMTPSQLKTGSQTLHSSDAECQPESLYSPEGSISEHL